MDGDIIAVLKYLSNIKLRDRKENISQKAVTIKPSVILMKKSRHANTLE